LKDIHKTFNSIDSDNLNHTYRDGIMYIDSITTKYNIIELIEGSKLLKINTIMKTDYRS